MVKASKALMKSIYKLSLVALAVVGLSACNQEEAVAKKVELTTEAQKEAYSVGASIGKYMSGHIKEQEEYWYKKIYKKKKVSKIFKRKYALNQKVSFCFCPLHLVFFLFLFLCLRFLLLIL